MKKSARRRTRRGALRQARHRREPRRAASALEERVAERTAELIAANEQLQKEVAHGKRAQEALRESERQFRLLVETIPALLWRGTPEGELDYLNQRAVAFLGHTAESLTG